jgi:hypothetical protein
VSGRFERGVDPLLSSKSIYELSVNKTTQVYISVIQPKKRSNTKTSYWYCDTSMMLLRKSKEGEDRWECVACALNAVTQQSHLEAFLESGSKYYFMTWSCIISSSTEIPKTNYHPFSLTTYSGASVFIESTPEAESDIYAIKEPIVATVRQCFLRAILSEIVECNDGRCVYPIVGNGGNYGLLMGIHGGNQSSFYVIAINGSANHYLSLRITIHNGIDGRWVCTALNRNGISGASKLQYQQLQNYDIPPASQQLLLVVTSTGTSKASDATKNNPSLRYVSSWMAAQKRSESTIMPKSNIMYLGSSMELCSAAYNALELYCFKASTSNTSEACGSSGTIEALIANSSKMLGASPKWKG